MENGLQRGLRCYINRQVDKARYSGQGCSSRDRIKIYFGSKNNKYFANRFNVWNKGRGGIGKEDDSQVFVLSKWVEPSYDTLSRFLCH